MFDWVLNTPLKIKFTDEKFLKNLAIPRYVMKNTDQKFLSFSVFTRMF